MKNNKLELMLRHRADYKESIGDKHNNFLAGIKDLGAPWNLEKLDDLEDIESELILVTTFDRVFDDSISGHLDYLYRSQSYLKDNAKYDDTLILEFNPDSVDLDDIINRILPKYIKAFGCYRATIQNVNIANNDWQKIIDMCNETDTDIDGRDSVFRINAVNFYDQKLCMKAFGLDPSDIVNRLSGKVESVSMLNDGVLLVYSKEVLPVDELERIDANVKSLLS